MPPLLPYLFHAELKHIFRISAINIGHYLNGKPISTTLGDLDVFTLGTYYSTEIGCLI